MSRRNFIFLVGLGGAKVAGALGLQQIDEIKEIFLTIRSFPSKALIEAPEKADERTSALKIDSTVNFLILL